VPDVVSTVKPVDASPRLISRTARSYVYPRLPGSLDRVYDQSGLRTVPGILAAYPVEASGYSGQRQSRLAATILSACASGPYQRPVARPRALVHFVHSAHVVARAPTSGRRREASAAFGEVLLGCLVAHPAGHAAAKPTTGRFTEPEAELKGM